ASILNTRPDNIDDLDQQDEFAAKVHSKLKKIHDDDRTYFSSVDIINYKSPEIYDSKDKDSISVRTDGNEIIRKNYWIDNNTNIEIKRHKEEGLINNDGVFGVYLSNHLKEK